MKTLRVMLLLSFLLVLPLGVTFSQESETVMEGDTEMITTEVLAEDAVAEELSKEEMMMRAMEMMKGHMIKRGMMKSDMGSYRASSYGKHSYKQKSYHGFSKKNSSWVGGHYFGWKLLKVFFGLIFLGLATFVIRKSWDFAGKRK